MRYYKLDILYEVSITTLTLKLYRWIPDETRYCNGVYSKLVEYIHLQKYNPIT